MPSCPSCGRELHPEAQFCGHCGYTLLIKTTTSTKQEVVKSTPKKRYALSIFLIAMIAVQGLGLSLVYSQYSQLQSEYSKFKREAASQYSQLETKYNELQSEFSKYKKEAISPPYTAISGREVSWHFKSSDGESLIWKMPIDTYRYQITRIKPTDYLNLKNTKTGETYKVMDYRKYVEKQSFSNVIPSLYSKINDDKKFIHEVWYIVSQLTIYSTDIGAKDIPRWPLETLTEAGGDCEDTSILVASMLKAAPTNYLVKLVYCDANNPSDPKTVNHVIVWVEAGSYKTFIETTSKTTMSPYTDVYGWYFEV